MRTASPENPPSLTETHLILQELIHDYQCNYGKLAHKSKTSLTILTYGLAVGKGANVPLFHNPVLLIVILPTSKNSLHLHRE